MLRLRTTVADTLAAGLTAAVASGVPSTAGTPARGGDRTEGAKAGGARPPRGGPRGGVLLAAAVPAPPALSLGWAPPLAAALPRGREPLWGAAAGLGIAALDLGVIGCRIPA